MSWTWLELPLLQIQISFGFENNNNQKQKTDKCQNKILIHLCLQKCITSEILCIKKNIIFAFLSKVDDLESSNETMNLRSE